MQISANYGLKLPEGTDNVKRQDFVDNFTGIDTQMKIINDNSYPTVTATGTNAYVGTTDRIKSLGKGTKLTLFTGTDATGNCTLNLNSYGVKNIKDSFGNVVNNLKKDIPYNLCYNGTDFILQGKGGGGNVTPDKLLDGATATGDNGLVVGNMPNITTDQTAATISQSGTTVSITVPKGYWDGTKKLNASATAIDADIVSGNIKSGATICGVAGSSTVVDTSTGTATSDKILLGESAFVNGVKITGTIPSISTATITPSTVNQTISAGQFITGTQTIMGDADLVSSNIKSGINLFGVAGSYDPLSMTAGDNYVLYDSSVTGTNSWFMQNTSYTTVWTGRVFNQKGTIRISYQTHTESSGKTGVVRITAGSTVGTARVSTYTTTTYTEDFYVNAGDYIYIEAYSNVQFYGLWLNYIKITASMGVYPYVSKI